VCLCVMLCVPNIDYSLEKRCVIPNIEGRRLTIWSYIKWCVCVCLLAITFYGGVRNRKLFVYLGDQVDR
jgi:hypothetical protein